MLPHQSCARADEIINAHPHLKLEQIHDALSYYYENRKELDEKIKRDASLSAKTELETESRGAPIRRTDAMIAAITINKGASLYTLDLKHFQPLKALGLKLFP